MKSIFKYIGFFLTAFMVAGAIAYYSVRVFTQSADEVILPELTGKNIIYVLETLTNLGLNAKLYGTQYDDTIPRYAVLSQDPKPGATIKKGRDIVIYISKGVKENIIPDVRQTPLKQSLILLEKKEFQRGQISLTYSSKTPKDSVIAQYPDPFSNALKGSLCNLLVSRGPRPVAMVMPKILGLPLEKAWSILDHHHLAIAKISSDVDPKKNNGIILSHDPLAGSHVTEHTPITLVVNRSKKNLHMTPGKLNTLTLLTHRLDPGFLKQHVRVETDMFGPKLDLYNEYMKPGTHIKILAPSGTSSKTSIFIDNTLVKTINIDPWDKNSDTGDIPLWESLPLPFYQPISPDWVKN